MKINIGNKNNTESKICIDTNFLRVLPKSQNFITCATFHFQFSFQLLPIICLFAHCSPSRFAVERYNPNISVLISMLLLTIWHGIAQHCLKLVSCPPDLLCFCFVLTLQYAYFLQVMKAKLRISTTFMVLLELSIIFPPHSMQYSFEKNIAVLQMYTKVCL